MSEKKPVTVTEMKLNWTLILQICTMPFYFLDKGTMIIWAVLALIFLLWCLTDGPWDDDCATQKTMIKVCLLWPTYLLLIIPIKILMTIVKITPKLLHVLHDSVIIKEAV